MAGQQLNVALKMTADVGAAKQALEAITDSQKRVELATSSLNRAQQALATTQADSAAGAEKLAKAHEAVLSAELRLSTATQGQRKAQDAANDAASRGVDAQKKFEAAAKSAGISVGQYKQAMREVPAQLTDIVTGLADGQKPLTVFMQQGGQLKDMFGSAGAAARALGSQLLGLVNPYTIAAAAGAALAVAWFHQQNELAAYNQALILTNGYAGRTAVQLREMAAQLKGVGHGDATDALEATAASGRFAGKAFDEVAESAARMKESVDRDVKDTIESFIKIADDPVKALLKLNESEHFLTQAQLSRIQALVAEGKEQRAVAEATKIYSDHLIDVAHQADAARTPIGQLMADIKQGFSNASAETGNFANLLVRSMQQASQKVANDPWYKKIFNLPGVAATQIAFNAISDGEPTQTPAPGTPGAPGGKTKTVDSKAAEAAIEKRKKLDQEHKTFADAELRYLDESGKKRLELAEVDKTLKDGAITLAEANKRKGEIEAFYAQQEQGDADKALVNLQREIVLNNLMDESKKKTSLEAQTLFDISQGQYSLASQATKDALLAAAKQRDAQVAEREEVEKAKAAYASLKKDLETPVEAAVDEVTKKVEALNAAIKGGQSKDPAGDTKKLVAETLGPLMDISGSLGGDTKADNKLDGEEAKLKATADKEKQWFDVRLAQEKAFRDAGKITQEAYAKDVEELQKQHETNILAIEEARQRLQLTAASSVANDLATIAKAGFGEQSKAYQVMFAISKAFAISQAAISLATNVAKASEAGYPLNIPLIIAAIGQGAEIAQMISSATFKGASGYATGGQIRGEGTHTSDSIPIWASDQEFMVRASSATQPGAVGFLNDFNARGMTALHDWAPGYAAGGQITAMPEARGQISDNATLLRTSNTNSLRLYNLFDIDALTQAVLSHPAAEKKIVTVASENGRTIRGSW